MSSPLLSTLVTFLLCALSVVADTNNHGVAFLYPTSSLTFHYKDTINVSYTSNFTSPELITVCNPQGSSTILTKLVQTTLPPYNGSSLVTLEWTNISTCWFDLRPNTTAGNGANSASFTVLPRAQSPPQTFSLSHPAGTPPIHPASHIALIAAIIATALLLSTILLLSAFFCWRRRQAKKNGYARTNHLQAQYIDQVDQKWHPGGGGAAGEYVYVKPMQSYGDFKKKKKAKVVELPVEERPVELNGLPSPAANSIELSGYPSPTVQPPFREGERYEPRRYEASVAAPVAQPKKHNRFSWQQSLRIG